MATRKQSSKKLAKKTQKKMRRRSPGATTKATKREAIVALVVSLQAASPCEYRPSAAAVHRALSKVGRGPSGGRKTPSLSTVQRVMRELRPRPRKKRATVGGENPLTAQEYSQQRNLQRW